MILTSTTTVALTIATLCTPITASPQDEQAAEVNDLLEARSEDSVSEAELSAFQRWVQNRAELSPLDTVIARSQAIVIAKDTGEDDRVEISLGACIEPFDYRLSRWEVIEWLHPAGPAEPNEDLWLSHFSDDALGMHEDSFVYDLSVSYDSDPDAFHFTPAHEDGPDGSTILFVKRGGFFAYDPIFHRLKGPEAAWKVVASEGPGGLEEILASVAKNPPAGRADFTLGVPGEWDWLQDRASDAVREHFDHSSMSYSYYNTRKGSLTHCCGGCSTAAAHRTAALLAPLAVVALWRRRKRAEEA